MALQTWLLLVPALLLQLAGAVTSKPHLVLILTDE